MADFHSTLAQDIFHSSVFQCCGKDILKSSREIDEFDHFFIMRQKRLSTYLNRSTQNGKFKGRTVRLCLLDTILDVDIEEIRYIVHINHINAVVVESLFRDFFEKASRYCNVGMWVRNPLKSTPFGLLLSIVQGDLATLTWPEVELIRVLYTTVDNVPTLILSQECIRFTHSWRVSDLQ